MGGLMGGMPVRLDVRLAVRLDVRLAVRLDLGVGWEACTCDNYQSTTIAH